MKKPNSRINSTIQRRDVNCGVSEVPTHSQTTAPATIAITPPPTEHKRLYIAWKRKWKCPESERVAYLYRLLRLFAHTHIHTHMHTHTHTHTQRKLLQLQIQLLSCDIYSNFTVCLSQFECYSVKMMTDMRLSLSLSLCWGITLCIVYVYMKALPSLWKLKSHKSLLFNSIFIYANGNWVDVYVYE